MSDAPILFTCLDDHGMVPASPYWAKKAAEAFVPGERYELVKHEDRSTASHNHLFAELKTAFDNLPEELQDEYPTVDRLRRKLLIKGGFCSEQSIACATRAEAMRWAEILRQREPDSVVLARGTVVRIFVAESMSYRTMDKVRFQAAKDYLLSELSKILSIPPSHLSREREVA